MRLFRSVFYPAVSCVLTLTLAVTATAQVVDTTVKVDSTVKTDSTAKTIVNQDQAVRGMLVFTKTCVECHTRSDITGTDFKLKWHTRPVYELFDIIRTTMPDDNPGGMTQDQYIDIVAYLLRLNGAAAGGAVFAATDTAMLKKVTMDIQVPSPNLDSVKVDTTGAKVDSMKVDSMKVDSMKVDSTKAKTDSAKKDTTRKDTTKVRVDTMQVNNAGPRQIGINSLFKVQPARLF